MSWLTRTIYAPASISYWPWSLNMNWVYSYRTSISSRTSVLFPSLPLFPGYDLSFPNPFRGMEREPDLSICKGSSCDLHILRGIIAITHPIIAGFDIWPGLYWPKTSASHIANLIQTPKLVLFLPYSMRLHRSTRRNECMQDDRAEIGGRMRMHAKGRSFSFLSIRKSYLVCGGKRKKQVGWTWSWAELFVDYHMRLTSQELQVREGCDISPCVCSGSCSSLPRVDFHEIEFRDTDRYGQAHAERTCVMRYALTRKQSGPEELMKDPILISWTTRMNTDHTFLLEYASGSHWPELVWKIEPKRFDHFDHTIFLTYMQKV